METLQEYHPRLVSVIIACYNCEQFIEETLDSVLRQTYHELEIIVVDDASTDGTVNLIESKEADDTRLKLLINEQNMGAAAARNRGLALARGRYIAICDADDLWGNDKIDQQLNILQKGNVIVGCNTKLIDEVGNNLRFRKYPLDVTRNYEKFWAFPAHSSIVFDRQMLPWNLNYDENYRQAEDYKVLLAYSKAVAIKNCDKTHVKYRLHKNNLSNRNFNKLGQASFAVKANVCNQLEDRGYDVSLMEEKIHSIICNSNIDATYDNYCLFKNNLRNGRLEAFGPKNLYVLLREKILKIDYRYLLAKKITNSILKMVK